VSEGRAPGGERSTNWEPADEVPPEPDVPTDQPTEGPSSAPADSAPELSSAGSTSRPDDTELDITPTTAGTAATEDHGDDDATPTLTAILESVLLVADQPVDEVTLAQVVERPRAAVAHALTELAAEYEAQGRGFELRNVAGGWRFYTRPDCAAYVERFVLDGQQARLTQAALETLAVVAYRQPVSRGRIAAVRGVNVDGVIRTLVGRGLVEEAGQDSESGAVLYRTTSYFLERLGIAGLHELPALADFLPDIESLDVDDDRHST
jgi:segregation and condensation protein B